MADAEWHRQHRKAKAERFERMRIKLQQIADRLDGNTKPLAVEIRNLALEGLSD